MGRVLGRVRANLQMGPMVLLRVHVPGWNEAKPGQFAMLQAEDSDCFLGRALSVSEQAGETVSFLIAAVGSGTRELCALTEGEGVWVLGPLGNGFDLGALMGGTGRVLLVGGGTGIAPLPLLVSRIGSASIREQVTLGTTATPTVLVLTGFRDSHQSLACEPLAESVRQAGEDGLACALDLVLEDEPGRSPQLVTDLLADHLRSGDRVAACGPERMARAVWEVCSSVPDVKAWFSLEARMACGVGSCHGCVVPLVDGSYARVCREGPVFSGEEAFGG